MSLNLINIVAKVLIQNISNYNCNMNLHRISGVIQGFHFHFNLNRAQKI